MSRSTTTPTKTKSSSPSSPSSSDNNNNKNGNNTEYIFKYIIIGDSAVGKSSIMRQFVNNEFEDSRTSTVGVEFGTKQITIGDNVAVVQLWDTAGQERFRSVTRQYYRGSACALLIFDISRRNTFASLTNWLSDAKNYTNPHTQFVLVGNKADLKDQRHVSHEEAQKFAQDNKIPYIETSAKTRDNIEEVFTMTAKKIFQNIETGVIDDTDKHSGVEFPLVIEAEPPLHAKNCAC